MSIGILGGTFNPIHYGHLRIAEEVRERFNLSKVIFVPAGIPPFKIKESELIESHHRAEMVRLAIKSNPFFEFSDVELKREGPSYTVDTLEIFKKEHPDRNIYFIAGADAIADLPKWRKPERILELAEIIVVTRPDFPLTRLQNLLVYGVDRQELHKFISGEIEEFVHRPFHFIKVSAISISGSIIRTFIKKQKSIKYLLPEEVEYYIIKNRILGFRGNR
ncbi:MAG: nicotinate-nucleotide adenylyltransferase [Thermodesulfovibrionales bacterium]|nr:nicotinate-nucleotide adenylyltransferase [Thermodesulfovibrionales bacterium]